MMKVKNKELVRNHLKLHHILRLILTVLYILRLKIKKGKIDFNVPQLKLDIKFELPMYNGEINAEKLDNWIRQIEVYCRIQNFIEDNIEIQLASL